MLVNMIDRIKKLEDDPDQIAIILSSYYWSAAFDKLDPTEVTLKYIQFGILKK